MVGWLLLAFILGVIGAVNLLSAMLLAQWMAWQWAVLLCSGPVSMALFYAMGKGAQAAEGE